MEEYSKIYTAVTGINSSAQELLKIGERIYYNEKIMNALNGFSRRDDILPERFFNTPGTSGNNIEIKPINKKDFNTALDNYYIVRGLTKRGMPVSKKALELGLIWEE